jgi:hypothetical protein
MMDDLQIWVQCHTYELLFPFHSWNWNPIRIVPQRTQAVVFLSRNKSA